MNYIEIDLITDRSNLVGFDEGSRYRKLFNLDKRDKIDMDVYIKIPDNVIGISSSFMMGLFSGSENNLTKDELEKHYIFVAKYSPLYRSISSGIYRLYSQRS